jgi:tRNA(Met) C34 N-acetyltransferase TmcA
MLQALAHPDVPNTSWLQPFVSDFKSRFIALLAGAFKSMSPALALSILNPKLVFSEAEASTGVRQGVMVTRGDGRQLSPYDLKRLQVRVVGQLAGSAHACGPTLHRPVTCLRIGFESAARECSAGCCQICQPS